MRGVLGHSDVDDLVQRVFLEFLASLGRFQGRANVATWLHRIAHNVVRKEMRAAGRHRRKLDAYGEQVDREAGGIERRVLARERLDVVFRALGGLDLRFREVWVLRELQGLSVEQVADALGERPVTIRTRHHRARKQILAVVTRWERAQNEASRAPGRGPAGFHPTLAGAKEVGR